MKRIFAMALCVVLLTSCIIETRASNTEECTEAYVEYSEFCENEAYYWGLVENGVTVFVRLDEEAEAKYRNQEKLVAPSPENRDTRGLTRPTALWNVAVNGTYTISDSSAFSGSLYSNYRFHGIRVYGLGIFNWSDNYPVSIYVRDAITSFDGGPTTLAPGYCMLRMVILEYETDDFYLEFTAPVNFINGYVGDYDDVKELV